MIRLFKRLVITAVTLIGIAAAQVNVPITVQEALWPIDKAKDASAESVANNAPGIARVNDFWSGGIPLLDSWQVSSVNPQVGLSGASVAMGQFRCMAVFPDGYCKWLLIDTQIPSLTAGGTVSVTLGAGTGNFGGQGSNIANDNGTTISINNTAMTCTITKAPLNMTCNVGATPIVTGLNLVLQGPIANGATSTCAVPLTDCTTLYQSLSDSGSTCSVEDNGPVRADIECHGGLKNGNEAYLNYQIRLHFYYNSTHVKLISVLKNATESTNPGNFASATKGFRSYEVRLSLASLNSPSATFATSVGTQNYNFTGSEDAYSWQGFSSKFEGIAWTGSYGVTNTTSYIQRTGSAPYSYVMEGYQIDANGTTIASGTRNQYQDGWADIKDSSGKGVTVGGYQFSAYWPKSLQFMGGGTDVRIGQWPDQSLWLNPTTANGNVAPYWIPWPEYWMDTVYLNLHTAAVANPGNEILKQQEFLVGRANWAQYNAANTFLLNLNDPTDTDNFIKIAGNHCVPSTDIPSACPITSGIGPSDFSPAVYRNLYWGGTGGGNQSDFPFDYLLQFYTRGFTGRLLWGFSKLKFEMEISLPRADGFLWSNHSPTSDFNSLGQPSVASANSANAIKTQCEDLHCHVYGDINYYFLTGDRTIKDWIDQAVADWFASPIAGPEHFPHNISAQREAGIYLAGLARLHNYAVSVNNSTLASNALIGIQNIYTTDVRPDLAVSGTGTSTTTAMFDALVNSGPGQVSRGTYGTSRTRGIFFPNTAENAPGLPPSSYNYTSCGSAPNVYFTVRLAQPYQISMFVQGMDEALQEEGQSWQYYNEAHDLNLGIVEWALSEGYINNGTIPDSGPRYIIDPDHVCTDSRNPYELCECGQVANFAAQTTWFLYSTYLKYTGDTSLNNLLALTVTKIQNGLGNNWDENGGYGVSNAVWWQHHPPATHMQVVPLTSFINNGGGSYTLGWTAPSGVQGYHLKTANVNKSIVSAYTLLQFNPDLGLESAGLGGTFGIDPNSNMPWFAASYTSNQPTDLTTGSKSITVTGLSNGLTQSNFMLQADVPYSWTQVSGTGQAYPNRWPKAGGFTPSWTDPVLGCPMFRLGINGGSIYEDAMWCYNVANNNWATVFANTNTTTAWLTASNYIPPDSLNLGPVQNPDSFASGTGGPGAATYYFYTTGTIPSGQGYSPDGFEYFRNYDEQKITTTAGQIIHILPVMAAAYTSWTPYVSTSTQTETSQSSPIPAFKFNNGTGTATNPWGYVYNAGTVTITVVGNPNYQVGDEIVCPVTTTIQYGIVSVGSALVSGTANLYQFQLTNMQAIGGSVNTSTGTNPSTAVTKSWVMPITGLVAGSSYPMYVMPYEDQADGMVAYDTDHHVLYQYGGPAGISGNKNFWKFSSDAWVNCGKVSINATPNPGCNPWTLIHDYGQQNAPTNPGTITESAFAYIPLSANGGPNNAMAGKLYVYGALTGGAAGGNLFWQYDPVADVWTKAAGSCTAAGQPGNLDWPFMAWDSATKKLYMFSGYAPNVPQDSSSIWVMDPTANNGVLSCAQWSQVTPTVMPLASNSCSPTDSTHMGCPPRDYDPAITYDPIRHVFFWYVGTSGWSIHGGTVFTYVDVTTPQEWKFDPSTLTLTQLNITGGPTYSGGIPQVNKNIAYDPTSDSYVLATNLNSPGGQGREGIWTIPAAASSSVVTVSQPSTQLTQVSVSSTYGIQVGTIGIATTSLPAATHNVAYSTTLTAQGGAGKPNISYTWSVAYGALPSGITLNSNTGVISGTTSQVGTFDVVIRVSDTTGHTGRKDLPLTVN